MEGEAIQNEPQQDKTISVIIVEYNTVKRTIQYIQDLRQSSDKAGLSFVVVDNAAENHEADFRDMPDTTYVHAGENLGFARGNNLGVKIADRKYHPDYYLFSNSDILLPEHLHLSQLLFRLDADERYAVIGPRIIGLDGINQSPSRRSGIWGKHIVSNLLWPVNLFIPPIHRLNRSVIDHPVSGEVYHVMGAFMLVKRAPFHEVQGFDEHTFLYAEEAILAERLAKAGYREYYLDEVKITHEEGGSTKKQSGTELNHLIKKRKRVFESEMYYFKTYRDATNLELFCARLAFSCFMIKLKTAKRILECRKR
jgi:GT2 family glycosyltransferase